MEENLNMGGKYSTGVIGKKLTAIDTSAQRRSMSPALVEPVLDTLSIAFTGGSAIFPLSSTPRYLMSSLFTFPSTLLFLYSER